MTYGIHATVKARQTPGRQAMVDSPLPEAKFDQLASSHHPMLPGRQFRERSLRRPTFTMYFMVNVGERLHRARVARECVTGQDANVTNQR